MMITGAMLIGQSEVRGTDAAMRAVNPATGAKLDPEFRGGGKAEVDRACKAVNSILSLSYRPAGRGTPENMALWGVD